MKVKLQKNNGDPLFKTLAPRTRLKFCIAVIIFNFILGIIGMLLGADLTALGVFLAMANVPLYAYVLGESFAPTKIPDSYYSQAHGGAGGLGTILNNNNSNGSSWSSSSSSWSGSTVQTQKPDEFNNQNYPQNNTPIPTTNKPKTEIG